jgi:signal transduction histidine kinase
VSARAHDIDLGFGWLEHAPALIWRASADARRDHFSSAWLGFTGRPLSAELDDGWLDAVHPEDRARCIDAQRDRAARGDCAELEYRLRRRDGEYRWLVERVETLPHSSGFVGACLDVHDRRLTADARLGFLASMAHELRTPLQVLQNQIELIRMHGVDRPTGETTLARLERQVQRLDRLVAALSAAARAERGGPALVRDECDLAALVRERIAAHTERLQPGAPELALDGPATLVARLDRECMIQVVDALVDNAIKFSPEGGRIDVRLIDRGGSFELAISDCGIGIPASDLARAGARYFRAENARVRGIAGFGLGLALARDLIERHGGSLVLSPGSPCGTIAVVRAPLRSTP